MKYLHILLVILLSTLAFFVPAIPVHAQTCTDAAGGPIPCPTTEEPNNDDNDGSGGGGSNPTRPELRFLGNNENYLDPANWNNGGRIPGADDSARLDGLTAVIDPRDPTPIPLGDLVLRNNAEIVIYDANVLFGTLDTDSCDRNATLLKRTARARRAYQPHHISKANDAFHNSLVQAQTFLLSSGCGVNLDTSLLDARRIIVQNPDSFIQFSLGGDQPASAEALGIGHYARMEGNSIDLDGQLDLFFVYGFRPQPGQTFQIITNTGGNPINGTFANMPEGGILNGFCDVQFRITYAGGDSNDVVLTAESLTQPDPYCNEDFSNPRPDGNVLLNASSLDLEPDQPIEVNDIQLVNGAEVDFHDGFLQSEILDIKDSTFKLFNSHLKVNTFIYTGPSIKPDGPGTGGPWNNPSFLEAERIIISQSGGTIHLGLGGNQPAGENALGKGHYARMQGDNVQLDGLLDIFFVYDFVPQKGQTFEIISVLGSLKGAFVNAPEGSFVNGYCDVGLSISYQGGDGNDVVLTAQKSANPNPEWECGTTAPSESQPETTQPVPLQEVESKTNFSPYLIGGGILVLIVLLVVLLKKRPA